VIRAAFCGTARAAADAIVDFAQGRSFNDYMSNLMLRSAVERQFEIIGEALSQLHRADPALAARIPDLRPVIGFRNALIHGYAQIDDVEVWWAIEVDLPPLRARVAALLAELGETP